MTPNTTLGAGVHSHQSYLARIPVRSAVRNWMQLMSLCAFSHAWQLDPRFRSITLLASKGAARTLLIG